MFKINLIGEIGWEIMAYEIADNFKEANGRDIDMIFNSPGGFISEGSQIDEMILQYKKDFPNAQLMATIIEAQSYASYLLTNPAFDLVVARKNSMVMIHNPLAGIVADYKEMKKVADVLERRAALFADRYSEKMKKPVEEIRLMMDEETQFIGGQEIVDAGIADEVMTDSEVLKDKMVMRASAESRIEILKIKIKNTKDDFEKIAAMSKESDKIIKNKPAAGGNNNSQEKKMDIKNIDDLKKELPDIHAETMKAGEDKGKTDEQARVKSLIAMKARKDFEGLDTVMARIDEGIANGENETTVELGIFAMFKKDGALGAAADSNEIGDLSGGNPGTLSGEKGNIKMTAEEVEEMNRVK